MTSFDDTLAGTGGVTPLEDDTPLRRGDLVGRYVVLEPLGRGANGIVYKAFDPQLDRAVALKLLLAGGTTRSREKLMAEAQALARVAHPNVIAIHDVGTVDRRVFYAMELVDGLPLTRWREDTSPSTEQILGVFRQAGAGLAAAHAAGLVHRDFKPDNVLVGTSGRVRVLDFGLALPLHTDALDTTNEREPTKVTGTPGYMAPEQFAGGVIDARTDQFAFCVALHEALTGERPFHGDTLAALSYAVMQGERADVDTDDVPSRVMDVIERGLALEPEQRFPSMDALLAALTPRARPRRGRLALGGTALLAVASGAAYGLGRSDAPRPTQPCLDTSAPIDALWTDARRQTIADAFDRSGAYNAASMRERTLDALDAYAQRWRDAAEASCNLAEVERELDRELTFRSQLCLDEALEAFEDRVSDLEELEAAQVQVSLDGVDALPQPEDCVDRSRLQLRVEIPRDPKLRASVEDLFSDLEDAAQLEPAQCIQRTAVVRARAEEIDHRPPLARVLEIRADCQYAAGRMQDARDSYERAFEVALATGYDALAIRAASDTAYMLANTFGQLDAAERWVRTAEALTQRHGLEGSDVTEAVTNVRGIIAVQGQDYEAAIAAFSGIANRTTDDPGGAHRRLAALNNAAGATFSAGRHREAAEYYEEAIQLSEEHYGADHEYTLRPHVALASVSYTLGDLEAGREMAKDAIERIDRAKLTSLLALRAKITMAKIEAHTGAWDAAVHWAEQAYALLVRLQLERSGKALDTVEFLAILRHHAGDLDRAEERTRELLEIARMHGQPSFEVRGLSRLGVLQRAQGESARGRRSIEQAVTLLDGIPSPFEDETPTLYAVGAALLELGDDARALEVFARAETDMAGLEAAWMFAPQRLLHAEALLDTGRRDDAAELLTTVASRLDRTPYPPEAVERARVLRARLDE